MFGNINGRTKILGLVGDPIEHTFSPSIHNKLCDKLNLNYIYIPFNIKSSKLSQAIEGFRAINLYGFNVTIPHKENIIPFIDKVSNEALLMGAVNTVKNIGGQLHGYNTDGYGFCQSLYYNNVSIKNKNIIILGAGGSARALSIKLAIEGAKSILILNRTPEKAKDISNIINDKIKNIASYGLLDNDSPRKYIKECDILINSTSMGMEPHVNLSPISDFNFLNSKTIVCDLIYNPNKTLFLSKAEKMGCKIINGWGMLIFQAIKSFEIWTEQKVSNKLIADLFNI